MGNKKRPHILFLCTGNSCRSQMAQGWMNHLRGEEFTGLSAGIESHGLNPYAVKVMAEQGVDISQHQSQHLDAFSKIDFDLVITVCDHANESCPFVNTNSKRMHAGFEDPPKLAEGLEGEERLDCYRKVCDQIRKFIEEFIFPE